MMKVILLLVSVIVPFWGVVANAQDQQKTNLISLPESYVQGVAKKMRPLLYQLKISDTEFIGQETEEELKDPLLTDKEVENALVRGIISVTAEWCELDWKKRSFEPFMDEQRASGKSEKQMAYIGALHGFGMGMMKKTFEEKSCTEAHINNIKGYLR